jgi:hypothetical protein
MMCRITRAIVLEAAIAATTTGTARREEPAVQDSRESTYSPWISDCALRRARAALVTDDQLTIDTM